MKPKPKPPDQAKIAASEALARLGIGEYISAEDMVFNALVRLWKANKRKPTLVELQNSTGLENISWQLRKLVNAGRVIKARAGVYIPIT